MGVRVVVAEDHALVRAGVVSMLDTAPDIEVVGTATNVAELLQTVDATNPDVVVSDIRMPPDFAAEGVEAAQTIRERHPQIGVVILSMYAEPDYIRTLLADGSAGRAYLLKSRVKDADELARAIHAVAEGDSVVDPSVVEVLLSPKNTPAQSRLAELSERERDVLAEMAAGCSNTAIAERLFMSPKTVEKHVGTIFAKLDIGEQPTLNRRVIAVIAWLERQQ